MRNSTEERSSHTSVFTNNFSSNALLVEGQLLYKQTTLGIEDFLRCRVGARRPAIGEGLNLKPN